MQTDLLSRMFPLNSRRTPKLKWFAKAQGSGYVQVPCNLASFDFKLDILHP